MIRKLCEKLSALYGKMGRRRVIVSEDYMIRHYLIFMGQEHDGHAKAKAREYPVNAFLHHILGSDEPVYHDHPWTYLTFIAAGGYWEHTPIRLEDGTVVGDKKKWYGAGSFKFARPNHFHWLEMGPETTWTIFIRFKRVNKWGFLPYLQKEKIFWKDWEARKHEFGIKRDGN
jgi:hypothetical protein